MGLCLLAIGAVIYPSQFLRNQSAIVRTARARRGNDVDHIGWPQYERTIFIAASLEALLQQSLDFNTANDLIDRATKPVQPV